MEVDEGKAGGRPCHSNPGEGSEGQGDQLQRHGQDRAGSMPSPAIPLTPESSMPLFCLFGLFLFRRTSSFSSLFSFTCSDHRARESEKIWGHISLPRSSAGVIADSLLLRPHSRGGGQARSQPTQHLLQFDSVIIVSLLV